MTGLILAAGRGHRLSPVTGMAPKCLATLGGRSLLGRQLELLRAAHLSRIVVVAGYQFAEVARTVGPDVQLIHNQHHAETNSLYSFWLARHLLSDGFIVLNCDVILHPQLLDDLLTCRHDAALLYAPSDPAQPYTDEEMKVQVRCGRVTAIRKALEPAATDGENLGVARFAGPAVEPLLTDAGSLLSNGGQRQWLPAAFDEFVAQHELYAIPTRGYPWIEIDSPEDYQQARDFVLPAIEDALHPPRAVRVAAEGPVQHV